MSVLAISPDGEWVAFRGVSDEPNRTGIYLRFTKELGARLVPGSYGSFNPFFSPDSKWLAFAADGFLQKVPLSGGEPKAGHPKQLFRADFLLDNAWAQSVDVSIDGRFLVVRHSPESRLHHRLVYVPGWTDELKHLNVLSE